MSHFSCNEMNMNCQKAPFSATPAFPYANFRLIHAVSTAVRAVLIVIQAIVSVLRVRMIALTGTVKLLIDRIIISNQYRYSKSIYNEV